MERPICPRHARFSDFVRSSLEPQLTFVIGVVFFQRDSSDADFLNFATKVLWVDRGSTGSELLLLPDTALNLQLPNRSPVSHLLGENQSASHFVF